eukprot:392770-Pyramimonas_sp.AAC.1
MPQRCHLRFWVCWGSVVALAGSPLGALPSARPLPRCAPRNRKRRSAEEWHREERRRIEGRGEGVHSWVEKMRVAEVAH